MRLECLHCHRVLEIADETPSFCPFCGQPLTGLALASTAPFVDPEATHVVPAAYAAAARGRIGGYRLIRLLGQGGMGQVYEAREDATGRGVAVKLIAPDLSTSREAVERFRREGRLASQIAHPRCVFVLAAEAEADQPYIVMELMPGATLRNLVSEHGPLAPADAVAKILDVIEGLQEAHRHNLLHRDVKPSNCFLDETRRVKIGDFGLAKSLVGDRDLTRTGRFVGTPLFASPEQLKGEHLDVRSDLYSVAATLYFLLAGRAPFECADAAAAAARTASEAAPPLRRLRSQVPPALEHVVMRGLERDPARRWRDLEEFRLRLLPFVPGHLSAAGMGVRLGAGAIDWILITIGVGIVQSSALRLSDMHTNNNWRWLSAALAAGLFVLYFGLSEGVPGQSLGKKLLGLRVCLVGGNRVCRDRPGFDPRHGFV
jgi:eukaryotic-like serine/threonine-protein kinase